MSKKEAALPVPFTTTLFPEALIAKSPVIVAVLPSMATLSTVRAVRVPKEVICPCAAVVIVPAKLVAVTVPLT